MAASRRPTALHEMTQLSAEVRELGSALGRVISRLEGREAFDTVETLRKLAKARRAGEASAGGSLEKAVAALSPAAAANQAMAFTLYFELVNLAEENFRIKLLRQRRAALSAEPGKVPAMKESIEVAIGLLKDRGVTSAQMQALADHLSIELVFTAHPTESKRRTLLTKLKRLSAILRQRSHPDMAPDPSLMSAECLEREIASLWLTDRSRVSRPEVTDEARTGLWYFDTTLYETLPRLQVDLERALGRYYPSVKAPRRWLTFGSWIGGDRDGNPNVTASVTAQVLVLHRHLAVEKLRRASHELAQILSVSDRRDIVSAELLRELAQGPLRSPGLDSLVQRYPHEPYRLLLEMLGERLRMAGEEAKESVLVGAAATAKSPAFGAASVEEALSALRASLSAGKGAILVGGDLRSLEVQFDVFGLHAARLDIRQHSTWHEAAVAELLGRRDYPKLEEGPKRDLLLSALEGRIALQPGVSEAARQILDPLTLVARAKVEFGPESIGHYVISMTADVSDMLEVELLQKAAGASLPITPLFETLEDLDRAPVILREYFALPSRRPAHQNVMLGYSDSNKDCGYLPANWALFKAQEAIARLCAGEDVRLTFFHGRGGSIARGGGPAAKAILAQPAGLRDGGIRVTEQGEVLSTRYHDSDLAHRVLEQMAYGVLLGSQAAQKPDPAPPEWREALEAMSEAGWIAYRSLVHEDPEFLQFWREATPIDEIGQLKLGSRPTYRRATQSVGDLRAIPWVFSWMQSRFNFPGWFGLGTGLQAVLCKGPASRRLLRSMHRHWPFFQTLIDNAQLTMRKADMGIAELYAGLVHDRKVRDRIFGILKAEFQKTEAAILAVTGQRQILGREPVLLKSVQLRNPYIDPLNYLQIEMLRRLRSGKITDPTEVESIRSVTELTINGISGGLKNTG